MKKLKQLPKFKNEDGERDFWAKHDFIDYFDVDKVIVNPSFPNLKPSTQTISIRLTQSLLNALKELANKKDVPYQSLMKMYLSEKVEEELQSVK
ncbi:MAG: BrnA antitoxin family protein [Candidatus Woykebacteria bacterium]